MKGILFKPDMRQAIIEDRKTVTRRTSGLKEINQHPDEWVYKGMIKDAHYFEIPQTITCHLLIKHRYHVGEIVYIKEACCIWCFERDGVKDACYKTDEDGDVLPAPMTHCSEPQHWRSPLFMPAWAARYFIQILDVRPERLQEITEEDAIAEGIPAFAPGGKVQSSTIPRKQYLILWDSINKEYPWSTNPWVFRYQFKRVEGK